jgi:hypothetical protein
MRRLPMGIGGSAGAAAPIDLLTFEVRVGLILNSTAVISALKLES